MAEISDANLDYYFWVSVLWGAIMGFFTYIVFRFPWWFVLNVPDDGRRGPFFRPIEVLVVVLLGMAISAFVFRILMRKKNRLLFSFGYPLAAFLLPFLLASVIFPAWFASPDTIDWRELVAGWVFISSLPQICSLPFGLISAVVFYSATRSEGDDS